MLRKKITAIAVTALTMFAGGVPLASSASAATCNVWANGAVVLRAKPSTTAKKIRTLPSGACAKYLGSNSKGGGKCKSGWTKVNYKGSTGWVCTDYTIGMS